MTIYHKKIGCGPNLVLLHGFGFHSGVWQELVSCLQTHFTLYLLDLPGFGLSRGSLFPKNFLHLIQALLPVLPEQAQYCGWSLGGFIAMALAIYAPRRVQKLMTIGSTPYFLESENWRGVHHQDFQQFYRDIQHHPKQGLKRFLALLLSDNADHRRHFIPLTKILFQEGVPTEQALLSALSLMREGDLRREIQHIHCDHLHVIGENDLLAPLNVSFPRVIIPAAGHLPFFTHRDIFLSVLQEFLHG